MSNLFKNDNLHWVIIFCLIPKHIIYNSLFKICHFNCPFGTKGRDSNCIFQSIIHLKYIKQNCKSVPCQWGWKTIQCTQIWRRVINKNAFCCECHKKPCNWSANSGWHLFLPPEFLSLASQLKMIARRGENCPVYHGHWSSHHRRDTTSPETTSPWPHSHFFFSLVHFSSV